MLGRTLPVIWVTLFERDLFFQVAEPRSQRIAKFTLTAVYGRWLFSPEDAGESIECSSEGTKNPESCFCHLGLCRRAGDVPGGDSASESTHGKG